MGKMYMICVNELINNKLQIKHFTFYSLEDAHDMFDAMRGFLTFDGKRSLVLLEFDVKNWYSFDGLPLHLKKLRCIV